MASPYGKGIVGLLKKGFDQIPAVMGTSILALIGIGCGTYACIRPGAGDDLKYKMDFIIYRSDDPRAKRPTRDWPQ